MPSNTDIYRLLRPVSFGLDAFEKSRSRAFDFRTALSAEDELERERARAEQLRQAYRQQYGEAPGGLAGPAPAPVQERQWGGQPTPAFPGGAGPGAGLGGAAPFPPLAEQEAAATQQALYGPAAPPGQAPSGPLPPGPTAQPMDAPAGAPQSGPLSHTMGTGGPVSQHGAGLGAQSPSQNPFIRKLYTIDPAAGREAEKHAYDSRTLELAHAKERVEYLGRVADGVLSVGTQEAHNVARAQLLQDGMPANQIPVAYDPTIWQMLSGTARTSAERLREGELQLQQAKYQTELRQASSKAPDYGYGDATNADIYSLYGQQLKPGEPPSPAMVRHATAVGAERKTEQARQTGLAGAEATGQKAYEAAVAKPLEGPQLQRINTMLQGEDVVKALSTEFTPEERKKFVGLGGARMTIQQAQQLLVDATQGTADPKFARFAALVALGQQEAFSTAGQALSGHERDVVFGYIPTGKEWSAEEFEQKLTLSSQRIPTLIDRELVLSTTPRQELAGKRTRGELPSMVPATPSPYAGRSIKDLTPAQRQEELDFLKGRK